MCRLPACCTIPNWRNRKFNLDYYFPKMISSPWLSVSMSLRYQYALLAHVCIRWPLQITLSQTGHTFCYRCTSFYQSKAKITSNLPGKISASPLLADQSARRVSYHNYEMRPPCVDNSVFVIENRGIPLPKS